MGVRVHKAGHECLFRCVDHGIRIIRGTADLSDHAVLDVDVSVVLGISQEQTHLISLVIISVTISRFLAIFSMIVS